MQDYKWAFNKVKLQTAYRQLGDEKKANPSIVINEETVKARYIKLLGLVLTAEEMASTEPVIVPRKPVIRRPVKARK